MGMGVVTPSVHISHLHGTTLATSGMGKNIRETELMRVFYAKASCRGEWKEK